MNWTIKYNSFYELIDHFTENLNNHRTKIPMSEYYLGRHEKDLKFLKYIKDNYKDIKLDKEHLYEAFKLGNLYMYYDNHMQRFMDHIDYDEPLVLFNCHDYNMIEVEKNTINKERTRYIIDYEKILMRKASKYQIKYCEKLYRF